MPSPSPGRQRPLGDRLRSWMRREDRTETIELPPGTARTRRSSLPPLAGGPPAGHVVDPPPERRDALARAAAIGALAAALLAALLLALVLLRPATVGLAKASDVADAIEAVSASIGNVEGDIAQIEARVSDLESASLSSEEIEQEVVAVRARVEELSEDLSGLRSDVSAVDAGALAERVAAVERRLDVALTRLSDAEAAAREDEGGGYCPTFLPLC